jgi:opacity protein-like surface antigen
MIAYQAGAACFAVSVVCLASTGALASDFYVDVQAGAARPVQIENSDEIEANADSLLMGRIAAGRSLQEPAGLDWLNLSVEASVGGYALDVHGLNIGGANNSATGDLRVVDVLANVWFGYEITQRIEAYGGGGAGVAFVAVDNLTSSANGVDNLSDSDAVFTYNAGAGVLYRLSDMWRLNMGYRYTAIPSYRAGSFDGELSTHSVLAGVRFEF